ncbi:hypothetical protein B9T29_15400 [Acinetobacter sp. ANC 3903]|uniref:hypothetical protein n=1 Tax=Acinetobacter sp. ANC 3903 TaxID=1977883 RepID=UPI000A34F2F6|nr:hypothetical protein [Acinetobacter sp. ANC 3903]OTG57058.1 hypothetical protein B9T29_15400 [Acinetobacter sp. ANC 3903]
MANPKPTSLRIFQPAKNKYNSAVCYGILGFGAAIIFSATVRYSYLNRLDHQEIQRHSVSSHPDLFEQDVGRNKENNGNKQQISTDLEIPANPFDLQIHQPEQESDLSQFFNHQTQLKSITKHPNAMHSQVRSQQYPSHNQTTAKATTKIVIPISTTSNSTRGNQPKIPIKNAVKDVEADELSQYSVIISETKAPAMHPENAVSP